MPDELAGGCLCGAVRYRVGSVMRAGYCHCRMCQKASGAPVVAWLAVPLDAFAWTAGAPAAYRSSAEASRHFCAACGSQLAFSWADGTPEIDVNLATLDAPEKIAPQYHIYVASRQPWLAIDDTLPRYAEGRAG